MKIIKTAITDIKIIEPQIFGDERGFFMETFRDDWFKDNIADKLTNILVVISYLIELSFQNKL